MAATGFKRQLAATLSLALAPVALAQGLRLRRLALRLPEAPGQRSGKHHGRKPALHLLAVGESPLAGVGLDSPRSTVASALAERLGQATDRAIRWDILAQGGFTAEAVHDRLLPRLDAVPADLILIGLGVNDTIKLRSATRWQHDLEQLITALRARTGPAPVLLAGVPDMRHFPALPRPLNVLLGSRSRLLDHAAGQLAKRLSEVSYVPLGLDARSQELFCDDGFHPNARGHALWAEQITPMALQLLGFQTGDDPD